MALRIGEIMKSILAFKEEEKGWGETGSLRTDGMVENNCACDLKRFGVGEYYLRHDVATFKSNLSEAAELYIGLFERGSNSLITPDVVSEVSEEKLFAVQDTNSSGNSKDGNYVAAFLLSMITFKQLLNALASGDMVVAQRLAHVIGGHLDSEREVDEPLDHYFGWTLKYMVDDCSDSLRREWIGHLASYLQSARPTLMGYPIVMQAIVDRNLEAANAGFVELLKGHRYECREGKMFGDTVDEIICVWGLGLANLARWRGLTVDPHDELIPSDLLF